VGRVWVDEKVRTMHSIDTNNLLTLLHPPFHLNGPHLAFMTFLKSISTPSCRASCWLSFSRPRTKRFFKKSAPTPSMTLQWSRRMELPGRWPNQHVHGCM
jgi:hypothetical protein